ncbi:MAG: hypothetical protein CYG60_09940 [Actinobacteria bacterium]|nr:Stp1/IreP family PP2C-type Ser/Thr phosphatase [Actinomycetota bacterium]PLS85922.1 MAG: hypothetical protein CYG60_09940 [Actinomycetota bacterium]
MGLYLDAFGSTNAGKVRKNNEDSLLTGDGKDEALFAVADGIGGFEAGEVASRIAIGVLEELEPGDSLEGAVKEANRRILAAARGDEKLSGMGTTIVAARFSVGDRAGASAEISHVGDSRAYLLRGGELAPITEDHSLVAELVRSGDLTRAEASEHPQKNLITRALGAEDEVRVDTAVLPVQPDDRVLLCSDGLTDMVPEAKVGELLATPEPEGAAHALVKAALDAGGADNVTVVVVDVKEQEEPAGGKPRTDTQEMRSLPQEAGPAPVGAPSRRGRRGTQRRGSSAKARSSRPRKGGSAPVRALAWIVRALAALMVLTALASPFYLWGSSRYYLGFDSGEVVIYRGLPEEYTLGYKLNEEFRRTDLRESEVGETYREPIDTHKLYSSREDAERVVQDLEDRETGRRER